MKTRLLQPQTKCLTQSERRGCRLVTERVRERERGRETYLSNFGRKVLNRSRLSPLPVPSSRSVMVDWSFLPVVERVLFILRRIDIARVEAKNRIPKLSRSGILYYVCVCVWTKKIFQ